MRLLRLVPAGVLAVVLAAPAAAQSDAEMEELLLGTWSVAERRIEYGNALVRQVGRKIHIADCKPDGTCLWRIPNCGRKSHENRGLARSETTGEISGRCVIWRSFVFIF